MTDNNHHDSGHLAVWVKAPAMVQEILVNSDPKRFFVPPYMGKKGWVGVRIDYKVKWDQTAAILKDGYLMSAPTKVRGKSGGRCSSDPDSRANLQAAEAENRTLTELHFVDSSVPGRLRL